MEGTHVQKNKNRPALSCSDELVWITPPGTAKDIGVAAISARNKPGNTATCQALRIIFKLFFRLIPVWEQASEHLDTSLEKEGANHKSRIF